jgi:hypothetical protein
MSKPSTTRLDRTRVAADRLSSPRRLNLFRGWQPERPELLVRLYPKSR